MDVAPTDRVLPSTTAMHALAHPDRVIGVRERVEVDGSGPWSRKHGALHVAPPLKILRRMVTLRIHLDAVTEENAPLLVAPGSHLFGRIPEVAVATVARCGLGACLAEPGDVWTYATPILHASVRAARPSHRRVLQVDYAVGSVRADWRGWASERLNGGSACLLSASEAARVNAGEAA